MLPPKTSWGPTWLVPSARRRNGRGKGDRTNGSTEAFLIVAVYEDTSASLRAFRRDQFEVLVRSLTLVVAIFAAGFFASINGSGDGALSVEAAVYAFIFGSVVPAILLVAWLIWLDHVLVEAVQMNRREVLRFQYPQYKWPESVHQARQEGRLPAPRAILGKMAGVLLFAGGSVSSLVLTVFRLSTSEALGCAEILFCGVGVLCATFGVLATIRVGWGVRMISVNLNYDNLLKLYNRQNSRNLLTEDE